MTETQTADLAAWLTAVWDEEERAARDRWKANPLAPPVEVHFSRMDEPGTVTISAPGSSLMRTMPTEEYQRAYLVRSPDERALARIAANRKILARCMRIWSELEERGTLDGLVRAVDAGLIVHDLASPYKGREGWQEEWE